MNYILGLPFAHTSLSSKLYDKEQIIKDIEYNYSIDSKRNAWDDNSFHSSTLHHSNCDTENKKFKKINYDKVSPEYEKIIKSFLSGLSYNTEKIKYNFEVVNYTCMNGNQYMREHDHIGHCDFFMIHYISFDETKHTPTIYKNTHNFAPFIADIKDTGKYLKNNLINVWREKEFVIDVKEDDIVIMPGAVPHLVVNKDLSKKNRITIVTNFSIII